MSLIADASMQMEEKRALKKIDETRKRAAEILKLKERDEMAFRAKLGALHSGEYGAGRLGSNASACAIGRRCCEH